MLLRAQFRSLVVAQLKLANTVARGSVFENRALPTRPEQMPMITVSTPRETKVSTTRGAPKFNTMIFLRVDLRVAGDTDYTTAAALDDFLYQVEMAILANSATVNVCQQFATVETHSEVDVSGTKPIGTATIVFQAEIYQVYDPATLTPLSEIDIALQSALGGPVTANVKIDLPA